MLWMNDCIVVCQFVEIIIKYVYVKNKIFNLLQSFFLVSEHIKYSWDSILYSVCNITSIRMDNWWEHESLIKFESPTSIFIVAPSNSGKTVLTKKYTKTCRRYV